MAQLVLSLALFHPAVDWSCKRYIKLEARHFQTRTQLVYRSLILDTTIYSKVFQEPPMLYLEAKLVLKCLEVRKAPRIAKRDISPRSHGTGRQIELPARIVVERVSYRFITRQMQAWRLESRRLFIYISASVGTTVAFQLTDLRTHNEDAGLE